MEIWRKVNLRADVNVSVRQDDQNMGTRCEIKNVNSIKFIQQAIEYEAKRQIEIIEKEKSIIKKLFYLILIMDKLDQ